MSSWKVICTTIIVVLAILTIFYAAFFTRWDAKGLHWGLHETPARYVHCRPTRYQRTPSGGYVTINTCYRRVSKELQERRKKEQRDHKRKEREHKKKEKELKAREHELAKREEKHHESFSFWGCIKNAFHKLKWQKRHEEKERRLRKQRRKRAAAHMEPITPVIIKPPKTKKHGRGHDHKDHFHPVEQIVPPFATHPPQKAPVTRVLVKKAHSHRKCSHHTKPKGSKKTSRTSSIGHQHGHHRRHSSAAYKDEFEKLLETYPGACQGKVSGAHHSLQTSQY